MFGLTGTGNRAHGKIDDLQPELKDTVDQMIFAGKKYREIIEFLAENEVPISSAAISRYVKRFRGSLEQIQVATETFRVIQEDMENYPDIDISEPLLRMAGQKAFSALSKIEQEDWDAVPPEKLIKNVTGLIRAAGYKKQIDQRLQTDTEKALEANQSLLFDILAKKYPDLYRELQRVLQKEKEAAGE